MSIVIDQQQPPLTTFGIVKQSAANTCWWAYSKFSSFPSHVKNFGINTISQIESATAKIKSTAIAIGAYASYVSECSRILWNPTPAVIEKIKNTLPKIQLTEVIQKSPGENKNLSFKILQRIKHHILPDLPRPLERASQLIMRNVTKPLPPPLTEGMLNKAKVRKAEYEEKIKETKQAFKENSIFDRMTGYHRYISEMKQLESKLQTANTLVEKANGVSDKSSLGTIDNIIHEVLKAILERLSVEKNLGNFVKFFLHELTNVVKSIQSIDLIGSISIEEDFIKGLTGNINVDAKKFKKRRAKIFKENLEKIASILAKKVYENSSVASVIAPKLISASLIEKIMNSLIEVFSEEFSNQLFNLLNQKVHFESKDLNGILESYQKLLQNGIQCHSVNIQFPKSSGQRLLDPEKCTSFKNNIVQLADLILVTFAHVIIDGLANYIDLDSKASSATTQAASNWDKNVMQKGVNANFTSLVGEIQGALSDVIHGVMGETLEFRKGNPELSSEAISKLSTCISPVARGAIFSAMKLLGVEIKKISIAEIISVIAEYLGEIAKT